MRRAEAGDQGVKEGMIEVGEAPESWGFTKENFAEDSYLWITGNKCTVSFIESKRKGRGLFSSLVKAIEADGFKVEVPTPMGRMKAILMHWGFKVGHEWDAQMNGYVEVWGR
jgi:hypothetical protein